MRSRGRAGEILVEDQRDDGSVVFLVCQPWDTPAASGVIVGPGEPAEEDRSLRDGVFPFAFAEREPKPFRITIDTTALPAGPLQFRSDDFIDAAGAAAADGVDHVTLDETNAKRWGLVREQDGG